MILLGLQAIGWTIFAFAMLFWWIGRGVKERIEIWEDKKEKLHVQEKAYKSEDHKKEPLKEKVPVVDGSKGEEIKKDYNEVSDNKQNISYIIFKDKKAPLDKQVFTIGRAEDNDLDIPNNYISRHHCKLVKIKNIYYLYDMSTNGTYLNGHRTPSEKFILLSPGDQITIWRLTFRVE